MVRRRGNPHQLAIPGFQDKKARVIPVMRSTRYRDGDRIRFVAAGSPPFMGLQQGAIA
jgi:hypothetical protein